MILKRCRDGIVLDCDTEGRRNLPRTFMEQAA